MRPGELEHGPGARRRAFPLHLVLTWRSLGPVFLHLRDAVVTDQPRVFRYSICSGGNNSRIMVIPSSVLRTIIGGAHPPRT